MTEYEKDESTGVISLNCNGTTELLAAKRPPENTKEVADWVIARNHSGRAFIPGNGAAYEVIIRTGGKDYAVCSGVTNSPTANKLCPVFVRVRAEEEVTEPKAPTREEIP